MMNTAPESTQQHYPRHERAFLVLAGIFLVLLIVANLITAKLFVLFGVVLAAGIIPYPVTFLATDLICEIYGQKRANHLVFVGFLMSLLVLIVLQLGLHATPFEGANVQDHYVAIFGQSSRAIIASMIAYLVAQLIDVRLFHFWKRLTKGKHLWLRNNASTMVSQLVDSALVITILFYGAVPNSTLIDLIIAGYLFKLGIAALDTPFFYFGARYLKQWIFDGKRPTNDRAFWPDLLLVLVALTNIGLLIMTAATFTDTPDGFSSTQNSLLMGMSVLAIHVTATMALAQPERRHTFAAIVAALATGLIIAQQLSWLYVVYLTELGFALTALSGIAGALSIRSRAS